MTGQAQMARFEKLGQAGNPVCEIGSGRESGSGSTNPIRPITDPESYPPQEPRCRSTKRPGHRNYVVRKRSFLHQFLPSHPEDPTCLGMQRLLLNSRPHLLGEDYK